MESYVITCCSTADMPGEFFRRRNIPYICFHFCMDGIVYPDDFGNSMSFEEFYRRMSAGSQPTTSQVNVEEYMNFFEPFLEKGSDILHVSLSSGISGSYQSACIAQQELLQKYPDRKIAIVDSRGASSGYGLLMEMLADRRDQGASWEEALAWAESNKLRIHHWFFSSDLTFFIKGGRISKTAGVFGTVLKICPLMNMDSAGHLVPRQRIRTKQKVILEMVEKMKRHAMDGLNYGEKCYISHSACPEDARAVADRIEAAFPRLRGRIRINSVGTVIGSHTGPGTVALFFVGDERNGVEMTGKHD
jgi:DegV family protein with EDD domain